MEAPELHEEEDDDPIVRIEVYPLGAGRDIGRSCIIIRFFTASNKLGATVVFDCGIHVGFQDYQQAFPDFTKINFTELDAVFITHYHIDHCGALPALTERANYNGPIYVTSPTKALLPLMLEDQLKSRGFSPEEIARSTEKCIAIETRQTYSLKKKGLELTCYRAGHVLGAAIFYVKFRNAAVVYTGNYNSTPDRHLGAYEFNLIPAGCPKPDILITESTYGSTTRGSQRAIEREFLDQVHSCLLKGGKVLVPSFAMGRVQEIVSLLESHWERMNLKFPILLCTKDAANVADIYKYYERWGGPRVSPEQEDFAFPASSSCIHEEFTGQKSRYIQIREPTQKELEEPGPLVLLANSAMLVGGLSLKAFRLWAGDEKNFVIFPGHCVKGTLGYKLLNMSGPGKLDEVSSRQTISVSCCSSTAPFSAHTDSKGILQIIHQTQPNNVFLVHGVQVQMEALKRRIEREIPTLAEQVYFPENFQCISVNCVPPPKLSLKKKLRTVVIEILDETRTFAATIFHNVEDFRSWIKARLIMKKNLFEEKVKIKQINLGLKLVSDSRIMELKWTPLKINAYLYHFADEHIENKLEEWMEFVLECLSSTKD